MKRFTRRPRPALEVVAPGERLLAWAETDRRADGRHPGRLPSGAEPVRVAWEQIEAADWDMDADR